MDQRSVNPKHPTHLKTKRSRQQSAKKRRRPEPQLNVTERPKRKIRPSVLYPPSVLDDYGFSNRASEISIEKKKCTDFSSPHALDVNWRLPIRRRASTPCPPSEESIIRKYLGDESSLNDVEVPPYLTAVVSRIEYVSGKNLEISAEVHSEVDDIAVPEIEPGRTSALPSNVDEFSERSLFDDIPDFVLRWLDSEFVKNETSESIYPQKLVSNEEQPNYWGPLEELENPSKRSDPLDTPDKGEHVQQQSLVDSAAQQSKECNVPSELQGKNSHIVTEIEFNTNSPNEQDLCSKGEYERKKVFGLGPIRNSVADFAVQGKRLGRPQNECTGEACPRLLGENCDAQRHDSIITLSQTKPNPSKQNPMEDSVLNEFPKFGLSRKENASPETFVGNGAASMSNHGSTEKLSNGVESVPPSSVMRLRKCQLPPGDAVPVLTFNERFVSQNSDYGRPHVYLWDEKKVARTEVLVPIDEAVSRCLKTREFSIYDGQDFVIEDQQHTLLVGLTSKDKGRWAERKYMPLRARKVRIWNLRYGGLRSHFRSPALQRISPWFLTNPENLIFHPSLLLPSSLRPSLNCRTDRNGSGAVALLGFFAQCVHQELINRIRTLRISQIQDDSLQSLKLWNTWRTKVDRERCFKSRLELIRFMFANPWLEPCLGQDKIFEMERKTFHKLIRVSMASPLWIGRYWDTVTKTVFERKSPTDEYKSVGEFLAAHSTSVLYQGQGTSHFQNVIQFLKESRSVGFYLLAQCGLSVQKIFFSQNWIAVNVDLKNCCTFCAVFWNDRSQAIVMQPESHRQISISSYLEANSHMRLYVGQDQSTIVADEVKSWLNLLKIARGNDAPHSAILTRSEFVPLKYHAVALPARETEKNSSGRRLESLKHDQSSSPERKDCVVVEREQILASESREREKNRVVSRDKTDLKVDIAENSTEHGPYQRIQNPAGIISYVRSDAEVIVLEPSVCTSIGSDDIHSDDFLLSPEFEDTFQNFEEELKAPAKTAARMIAMIKEVGLRILRHELVHDLRQSLYENFSMEVETETQLLNLVQSSSDLHFVPMAAELCSELQALDISRSFIANEEIGYGANDLLSVRQDLEAGRMCTMSEVIKKFRATCQDLIQFNEGFHLGIEALELSDGGESVITRFMEEKSAILQRESKICTLAKLCERAKQIGFRKQFFHRDSSAVANVTPRGSERTLRASRDSPRVTFLNYRDEKGNSVMGKRNNVRVFGLPIDRRACEREFKGVRLCHVCGREVLEAEDKSLICSNRFFGMCNESLCKLCLQTVSGVEALEFIGFRDRQDWICVHCRGLCPAESKCMANGEEGKNTGRCLETVRFEWHHQTSDQVKSIKAIFLLRHDNGDFDDDSGSGEDVVSLSIEESNGVWCTTMKCQIGAYRAYIVENGSWTASTTFYVLPSHGKMRKSERKDGIPKVCLKYYSCENRPIASVSRRGPRVHWTASEDKHSGPIHAIRSNDSSALITHCSRTQGYDWRRAKRHSALHWRPWVQEADPVELQSGKSRVVNNERVGGEMVDTVTRVVLSPSDKKHDTQKRARKQVPRPRPGLSHKEFCALWNTFKYDEMLKSVWGIVTGRSDIHGIGLFTMTGYQRGDFIIQYTGHLIRTPIADVREARYVATGLGTYFFKINEQEIVDATVQSNRARFTNHSCDPNMIANIIHVRGRDLVVLQATRDIPRFAELTFDYKLPYEDTKLQCLCNAWNCIGVMN